MLEFTYDQWVRLLTGGVLLFGWYMVSRRTAERWPNMTRIGKRLWLGYYGLLFALLYATVDSYRASAEITSKNYVMLVFATLFLVAGLLRLDGDESTEPVYRVQLKGSPLTWRIVKLR